MLTKDQILHADDMPRATVNVPEWGGDVAVKTMTAGERDKWELLLYKDGKPTENRESFRASLLAARSAMKAAICFSPKPKSST